MCYVEGCNTKNVHNWYDVIPKGKAEKVRRHICDKHYWEFLNNGTTFGCHYCGGNWHKRNLINYKKLKTLYVEKNSTDALLWTVINHRINLVRDYNFCPLCVPTVLLEDIYSQRLQPSCSMCKRQPNVTINMNSMTCDVEQIEWVNVNNRVMCKRCSEYYVKCPKCNEYVTKENIISTLGCTTCFVVNMDTVYSHDYVMAAYPVFNVKGEKVGGTLGTELEFFVGRGRNRNWISGALHKLFPPKRRYICKHDGSVQPGFEVVTMPMTLQYLKQDDIVYGIMDCMKQLVPEIPELISGHPHCGLHVHVGRAVLTPLQIYKMAEFTYVNQENLTILGRRPLVENCHCCGGTYCSGKVKRSLAEQVHYRGGHDERYQIINLSNNNTVEFRFFKGTTNPSEVFVAVELADAIRKWAEYSGIGKVSWEEFTRFINQGKDWENLYLAIKSNQDKFKEHTVDEIKVKKIERRREVIPPRDDAQQVFQVNDLFGQPIPPPPDNNRYNWDEIMQRVQLNQVQLREAQELMRNRAEGFMIQALNREANRIAEEVDQRIIHDGQEWEGL